MQLVDSEKFKTILKSIKSEFLQTLKLPDFVTMKWEKLHPVKKCIVTLLTIALSANEPMREDFHHIKEEQRRLAFVGEQLIKKAAAFHVFLKYQRNITSEELNEL